MNKLKCCKEFKVRSHVIRSRLKHHLHDCHGLVRVMDKFPIHHLTVNILNTLLYMHAQYYTGQSSGDLRLVRNGFTSSSYTSGRLEVYYSRRWGTVCNDYWTRTNSDVACRQLGFAGAATLTSYRTSLFAG